MAARHDGASETASVVELRRVGVVTGKVASSALPVIVGVSAVASVSTLGFVIGLPLMLLGGLLVTRSSRIVFRADDAGITIRNVAYTRSWSWEDVGEVGWDDSMGRGGGRGLSVGPLHDPYTYVATATARSRPLWSSSDVLFVDEEAALRRLLAAHGVSNRILDSERATPRWSLDQRSRTRPATDAR